RLGGQLSVGLAAADGLEVVGDEVVGVDLGLGAGGQLLAAVWAHGGEFGGGDGFAVRGGEVDLLSGELGADFAADEGVGPGQQAAGGDQGDGEEQAGGSQQDVEVSASH